LIDLLAQSLGYKNFRDFQTRLSDSKGELHGMRSVRLDGEKEVTSREGLSTLDYKNLGYRFYFKDGNTTRFDVN
jgi:DNA-binding MurR/RpiR family transcriptional regulator